jgi:hypothetical protein
VLGESHEETLATSSNLANVLGYQDRFAEAEAALATVHAVQKRTLGDDHEHTMLTFQNMALVIFKQGRIDEAEAMLKEALLTATRVLGKGHPRTQGAIHLLQTVRKSKAKVRPNPLHSTDHTAAKTRQQPRKPKKTTATASVASGGASPTAAAVPERFKWCSLCHARKPVRCFSSSQLKKNNASRKCVSCCEADALVAGL